MTTAPFDGSDAPAARMPSSFDSGSAGGLSASFSRVPVSVQIVLGSARLPLSELLAMQSGTELSLSEKPGDPVTVLVNGCTIAKGELYVLEGENERFGVKITEIFEGTLPL